MRDAGLSPGPVGWVSPGRLSALLSEMDEGAQPEASVDAEHPIVLETGTGEELL